MGSVIITLGIACSTSPEQGREAGEIVGEALDVIEQTIPDKTDTAEQPLAEPVDVMDRIEYAIRASLRR